MRLKILIILVVLIALILISFLIQDNGKKACINNKCYTIEIAQTPYELSKGLMFRSELKEDNGMLFVFGNSGIHSFWMKDTLIPLDIIWINENKVVFVKENSPPLSTILITPSVEADYVLELNAGEASHQGFNVGDLVEILPANAKK